MVFRHIVRACEMATLYLCATFNYLFEGFLSAILIFETSFTSIIHAYGIFFCLCALSGWMKAGSHSQGSYPFHQAKLAHIDL